MNRGSWGLLLLAAFLGAALSAFGEDVKPGYLLPKVMHSPNGRYAISVPIYRHDPDKKDAADVVDSLIEIATGKTVAILEEDHPAYNREVAHNGPGAARWSNDSSLLLWKIEGKWFAHSLVLLKIQKNRVAWKLDLLKTAQQEILTRSRKAEPEKYSAAKKANAGSGSAFPEGFSVFVWTDADDGRELKLPLAVHVSLTANLKKNEDMPNLDSSLEGVVSEDGKFTVKSFAIEEFVPRDYAE